jgi:hypothetical protein
MAVLDQNQLETLRRQVEEDYRLDLAAIERLQRRFISLAAGHSTSSNGNVIEKRVTVLPTIESQAEPQPDELTNTLRGMFTAHRK